MQSLVEILGWMGSVLYLLAYALVSLKKTDNYLNYFKNGSGITATTYYDWKLGFDIPDITNRDKLYAQNGGKLVSNHTYFVTDMSQNYGEYISLYNPWGTGHVTLAYNDFKRTFTQMTITQLIK